MVDFRFFVIFVLTSMKFYPYEGGDRFWQQAEFDCKHVEHCVVARKYQHSNYKWQ